MKVISLNTWGGRGGLDALLAYLGSHQNVDVFCFQEVWNGGEEMVGKQAGGVPLVGVETDLLRKMSETLPHHRAYFRPHFRGYYGLAMLVHESLAVMRDGEVFVYKEPGYESEEDAGDHARNIQYVTVQDGPSEVTIVNFHGLWRLGANKNDIEDRLLQSDNIARFLKEYGSRYVFMGDFNLLPNTESLKRFETAGLRNLIAEYGITSTRTSFYTKSERFADYAFVSPDIEVKDFRVLPDEVSDHSPLYIEFI